MQLILSTTKIIIQIWEIFPHIMNSSHCAAGHDLHLFSQVRHASNSYSWAAMFFRKSFIAHIAIESRKRHSTNSLIIMKWSGSWHRNLILPSEPKSLSTRRTRRTLNRYTTSSSPESPCPHRCSGAPIVEWDSDCTYHRKISRAIDDFKCFMVNPWLDIHQLNCAPDKCLELCQERAVILKLQWLPSTGQTFSRLHLEKRHNGVQTDNIHELEQCPSKNPVGVFQEQVQQGFCLLL